MVEVLQRRICQVPSGGDHGSQQGGASKPVALQQARVAALYCSGEDNAQNTISPPILPLQGHPSRARIPAIHHIIFIDIVKFFSETWLLRFMDFLGFIETDRQYEIPQVHRTPKPSKDTYLIEQVFSPQPFPSKSHMKGNPLYTDMRLTEMSETKRPQPSWTIEEYKRNSGDKGKLAALDLQTQESLNPNNLEYWMEDIYTPGYDSLLKRKEAEFRRAKVCKIAALIAAAACTVILYGHVVRSDDNSVAKTTLRLGLRGKRLRGRLDRIKEDRRQVDVASEDPLN
ncbi:MNAR1 protein, partial [Polypterus senegalus]